LQALWRCRDGRISFFVNLMVPGGIVAWYVQ
jgi:hypothetical protein